jgi:tRNA(Met) C34 N-acetyltransferase TmcA
MQATVTLTTLSLLYLYHTSQNGKAVYSALPLGAKELISVHLTHHDLKRLELYARNMVDHHMIGDILPTLARLLFLGRLRGEKHTNSPKIYCHLISVCHGLGVCSL